MTDLIAVPIKLEANPKLNENHFISSTIYARNTFFGQIEMF